MEKEVSNKSANLFRHKKSGIIYLIDLTKHPEALFDDELEIIE